MITEACEYARRKRDLFDMDVHVLKDERDEYFTVLEMNLNVFLKTNLQIDKTIYYTAWYMKK